MKIISVCNQKGGVAKSTTAVNISHGLARHGKGVLLVDLDPQGQLATLLAMKQEPRVYELIVSKFTTYKQLALETGRPNLYIIPGDRETAAAQAAVREKPISLLRDKLTPASKNGFDYVILDTAPSVGDIQALAVYAADYLLIPSAVDFLSVEGALKMQDTVTTIQSNYDWKGEVLGILPTFFDAVTKETTAIMAELEKNFPKKVLDPINRATVIRESAAYGQTLYEYAPSSRACKQYERIVNFINEV